MTAPLVHPKGHTRTCLFKARIGGRGKNVLCCFAHVPRNVWHRVAPAGTLHIHIDKQNEMLTKACNGPLLTTGPTDACKLDPLDWAQWTSTQSHVRDCRQESIWQDHSTFTPASYSPQSSLWCQKNVQSSSCIPQSHLTSLRWSPSTTKWGYMQRYPLSVYYLHRYEIRCNQYTNDRKVGMNKI